MRIFVQLAGDPAKLMTAGTPAIMILDVIRISNDDYTHHCSLEIQDQLKASGGPEFMAPKQDDCQVNRIRIHLYKCLSKSWWISMSQQRECQSHICT